MGAAGIESLRTVSDWDALRATLRAICRERKRLREATPTDHD
jgi:hypothetical protein